MVMTYLDGGLVKDVSEHIDVSISRAAKAVEFVLRDVAKRLESVSNEEGNPIKSSAMKDVARVVRKHARHTVNIFKENEMADRNYKKEYEEFHATPEQKKRRAQRNAARKKANRTKQPKRS